MPASHKKTGAFTAVNYRSKVLGKIRYTLKLSKLVSDREGISRARQFGEIIFLYTTRRLGPLLYFEQGLWRIDMSLKQKQRYLNEAQYRAQIRRLNPPLYQKLSQYKLAEKAILQTLGVPTPGFVGFLHGAEGVDTLLQPLTNESEFSNVLKNLCPSRLCFKLSEGWGGRGFVAAEVFLLDGEVKLKVLHGDDQAVTAADFYETYLKDSLGEGLIIERYIDQHEVLNRLNPTSVNTLRLWLIQKGKDVKLVGGILRIGRRGALVDNASQGGLLVNVDLVTGRLSRAKTAEIFPDYYSHHPDSGQSIENLQLPGWEECVALAKQCLRVFPKATFVGLDMAITENGPVVVELNLEPDRISARNFDAPLADLLTW